MSNNPNMTNLDISLQDLKKNLLDMMELVTSQLEKCKEAIIINDRELAKEIVSKDKRVNAMELKIDRDCENILALFNPVATDLRFVIAALKISHHLERIGDNAKGIAGLVVEVTGKNNHDFMKSFKVKEMFESSTSMLGDIHKALITNDTRLARKIFKKDEFLNMTNLKAPKTTTKLIVENPKKAKTILALFSTIRKLERVGDLAKNMGEEIIFHIDAEVLKHQKNKK